jgi:hypothetical protein
LRDTAGEVREVTVLAVVDLQLADKGVIALKVREHIRLTGGRPLLRVRHVEALAEQELA